MQKWIILCLVFFSFGAYASSPTKFKMKNGSISFLVPEKWENAKGLFGIQLMFLGPMKSENRPVVTVESTDFTGMHFDHEALEKNQKEYQEGREAWLKKYDGKSLEFFKYQKKELKPKVTDHNIGYRFEIGANEFIEHSHYISCGSNLYHLKTLVRANEESANKASLEQILNSFNCE